MLCTHKLPYRRVVTIKPSIQQQLTRGQWHTQGAVPWFLISSRKFISSEKLAKNFLAGYDPLQDLVLDPIKNATLTQTAGMVGTNAPLIGTSYHTVVKT